MEKSVSMWIIFILTILILLALDLGVFNKKNREINFKESLWISYFYIFIAFIFGLWILYSLGSKSFLEYITGFIVEKSLALDNIFLISLIFSTLSIPLKYQHRVLFWGIIGVLVLRGFLIAFGVHLINKFHWVLYIFAIFMILTGIKMFFVSHKKPEISNNKVLKWIKKHLNVTEDLREQNFFVSQIDPISKTKKIFITPLFLSLIMVEFIDLVFAIDSIPAILIITQDPYIVYTSNIFAILGLRSLYFTLAFIINRFYYLKYSLALVLIFIGSKIFFTDAFGIEKIPMLISPLITISIIACGIFYSIFKEPTNSTKEKL